MLKTSKARTIKPSARKHSIPIIEIDQRCDSYRCRINGFKESWSVGPHANYAECLHIRDSILEAMKAHLEGGK